MPPPPPITDTNRHAQRTDMFGPGAFQERVGSECGKPLLRHARGGGDNVSGRDTAVLMMMTVAVGDVWDLIFILG